MANLLINRISTSRQYRYSLLFLALVSVMCYGLSTYMGYRVIAYILLLAVSLVAMVFDILPVLITAVLTAVIWDFFFIPPRFTFRVNSAEDLMMLLMYLVIAMVNAGVTYKIRQAKKEARRREQKENTIKLYNTLLNSLSHELRTPIATIIGATDNLQAGSDKLTALNRYELMSEISKAALRLNQQVENLLNMSRLESGFIQPKLDWCDINELVYDVVKTIEETKPAQKIHISISPDLPLYKTDKGMLEQVVYNLVSNAVTYTPPGSAISIAAISHADVLQIVIEDDGVGFPANELPHVFDKFYRLKDAKAGGTGLGLSIVKGYTEALGGTVELNNVLPHGARFTLDIPAKTSYLKNLKNE